MKFPKRDGDEDGGTFLKIKDGENVIGVLRGEIFRFYQKGFGASQEIVGLGEGGKPRYRHNLAVKEGGKFVMKVWEFGVKIYDKLYALEQGGWDLASTIITISRQGSTKENTKYEVTPMKTAPSAASLREISALEMIILDKNQAKNNELPPPNEAPWSDSSDEIPF